MAKCAANAGYHLPEGMLAAHSAVIYAAGYFYYDGSVWLLSFCSLQTDKLPHD